MKKILLIILVLILIGAVVLCNLNKSDVTEKDVILTPIDSISLTVREPSGLYFDSSTGTLWTVSDENSTIYNIDLKGKVLQKLVVNGLDLEGITKINDTTLVTILERDRAVVFLDNFGKEKNRLQLDLKGKPNKGLEGISYNKSEECFYVLNEKDPGLLIKMKITGEVISTKNLSYTSDYSGITYLSNKNELWITSDEAEAILKCTSEGELLEKYSFDIEQVEGIAIDEKNSLLYLISDPLEKLFVFNLP